jgi:hypothetical protein
MGIDFGKAILMIALVLAMADGVTNQFEYDYIDTYLVPSLIEEGYINEEDVSGFDAQTAIEEFKSLDDDVKDDILDVSVEVLGEKDKEVLSELIELYIELISVDDEVTDEEKELLVEFANEIGLDLTLDMVEERLDRMSY